MANMLKMEQVQLIQQLIDQGWTQRRIAREFGFHRNTIRRYIAARERAGPTCTLSTAGTEPESKCTISTAGSRPPGRPNACEPWREKIEGWLEQGLSAQRIYQDLVAEAEFPGSYEAVKRFVRGLRRKDPRRFERVETAPGIEVQVDFGTGNWLVDPQGRRRRTHVFRMVLSHSRKGYSEAVFRQDTETFLRCLENAFRSFGGAPQAVVLDNLKAAIPRADWYDPDVHPKLRDFAAYYRVAIMPTKPYHPHHKGKIERGIGYVKDNALKGRTFSSLREINDHLRAWEAQVADKRIHGTTRKQVGTMFEAQERPVLQPLPAMVFPTYREGERKVHRDGFVEVERAYYEAPPEYVGRTLWVRWDSRMIRLFNHRMQEVGLHPRVEAGVFSYRPSPGRDRTYDVQRSSRWLLKEAQNIGHWAGMWAEELLVRRGREAVRSLLGLRDLTRTYAPQRIDHACDLALRYGTFRLRDIRRIADHPPAAQPQDFDFMTEHELIRDMAFYQAAAQPQGVP